MDTACKRTIWNTSLTRSINRWLNGQLWLHQKLSAWLYIHMFIRYVCVIIFMIPYLDVLKNNIHKPWSPWCPQREPWCLEGSCQVAMLGHRQGERRVRDRNDRLDGRRLNSTFVCQQKESKECDPRFKPDYLQRYSPEKRTHFGKGIIKTFYFNIIISELWYFSGNDPEKWFLLQIALSRQIHLMALVSIF